MISKYHPGSNWRLRVLLTSLPLDPQDVILDAGCGDGYMSCELAKVAGRVVGVDIAKAVIEANKPGLASRGVEFVTCDLCELDQRFAPGTFTKIACLDVLEHVGDVPMVMRNFRSVLANGGFLCVLVPLDPHHGHFGFKVEGFRALLGECGLIPLTLEVISPGPATTLVVRAFRRATRHVCGSQPAADTFDQTRAFRLAQAQSRSLRLYEAVGFPLLNLFMGLDRTAYVPGSDSLLAVARKETA